MRFSNHFLGGEALRRERFARILAQADAAAPEPPSPAFVFPDLPPPSAPSLAVGNAIRLADSVRIFEQNGLYPLSNGSCLPCVGPTMAEFTSAGLSPGVDTSCAYECLPGFYFLQNVSLGCETASRAQPGFNTYHPNRRVSHSSRILHLKT